MENLCTIVALFLEQYQPLFPNPVHPPYLHPSTKHVLKLFRPRKAPRLELFKGGLTMLNRVRQDYMERLISSIGYICYTAAPLYDDGS